MYLPPESKTNFENISTKSGPNSKKILWHNNRAHGEPIHEKNLIRKSQATVPLTPFRNALYACYNMYNIPTVCRDSGPGTLLCILYIYLQDICIYIYILLYQTASEYN